MRDIYEEAELSPGAVYHYFAGTHDIVAASFDFDYEPSLDLFRAAKESDDPLAALEGMVNFFFRELKGAAALGAGRVNVHGWGEALVNPPLLEPMQRVFDTARDSTAQIIRRAQALGQVDRSLDPLALGQAIPSQYYGLELQLALDPGLDVDKYAAAVKAMLRSLSASGGIRQGDEESD